MLALGAPALAPIQSTRGLGKRCYHTIQTNNVLCSFVTSGKISDDPPKREAVLFSHSPRRLAPLVSGLFQASLRVPALAHKQGESAIRGTAAAARDSLQTWALTAREPTAPIAELLTTERALNFLLSPHRETFASLEAARASWTADSIYMSKFHLA